MIEENLPPPPTATTDSYSEPIAPSATRAQPITLPLWAALVPILLLGFFIFVHGLMDTALWSDEGWTIAASAESNPVAIITEWVAVDVHPPLFFIGLNFWRNFTGDTIFEMRYYSVMLSMLGIAVAYRLGKSVFDNRAGVLAALFYALHDLVRVLTHEVRHYPQQMLLSTVAMWLYWRFWKKPTRGRGIAFALAGAALIYTHYWGGFVLLALAIHALITRWRQLRTYAIRTYAIAFVGIALLYLPWLPVLYNQITLERPGGLPHALENTPYVYAVLTYQLIGIPELFWTVLAVIGTTGLLIAASTHWVRRILPTQGGLMLALAALLPPVLSVLINTVYPTLSFRALAVVVPAVIVLAAYGLSQFRTREQYALLVFVLLYSISTQSAGPIDRPPWPEMSEFVATHTTPLDTVLLENDSDEHTFAYYLDQTGADIDYAYTESTRELKPETYPTYINEALTDKNGLWVVKLGWPPLGDIRPELAPYGFLPTTPEIDYGMYNDRPVLLWRLDRLPQSPPVTVFGDEMRLMTAEALPHQQGVTVNLLWWSMGVPSQEYTVSVFVRGAEGTFRNDDSRPMNGLSPTTTWQPDGLYFDSHVIPIDNVPPGEYQVGVQVYYFLDDNFSQIENIPASACDDDPDCRFVIVDTVHIE